MSSELGQEPITLDELLEMAHEAAMAGVHVSLPATVVSYDRTAGTVEVSIPVDALLPDGNGNLVAEAHPNLKSVPVCFPRCRAFAITFPLVAGDTGQLVICERSISAWRAGTPGHPGDTGQFTLDGSVFHPGLYDDAHAPKAADADNMVVGSETDAKGRVVCKPSALELGQGATKGVVLAGDKTSADTTMATWIGAITTFVNGITPGTATAPTDFGKNGSGSSSTKAL